MRSQVLLLEALIVSTLLILLILLTQPLHQDVRGVVEVLRAVDAEQVKRLLDRT